MVQATLRTCTDDAELTIPETPKYDRDAYNNDEIYKYQTVRRATHPTAEEIIDATARAYADQHANNHDPDERALKFHTRFLHPDIAARAVEQIGRYNHFNADEIAAALRAFQPDERVLVARESSPALYVWTARPAEVAAALGADEYPAIDEVDVVSTTPGERDVIPYGKQSDDPEEHAGERALVRFWWD